MKDLKTKEHLRKVNMLLSEGRYPLPAAEALRCWTASPTFLVRRALDELHLSGMICNGVNPQLYLQHKDEFWPSSAVCDPQEGRSSQICPQYD
jgi:hypothetical protein